MIVTSKELKRRARAALSGRYFLASTLTMTLSLVTLGLSFLLDLSGFGESAQPMHQFFFWALWFIMLILGALFEVGLLRVLYACSKKEPSLPRGVLFYAFKNQPDTFILTSAFQYLITLIWFVPALWKYMTFPIPNTYEELLGELIPVLLLALAGLIPAVIASLPFCLTNYVLLDSPEILSPWAADRTAQLIFEENAFTCDGLIIGSFIGSDGVKPFLPYCKDGSKALFVVVRSPNKSASELQDLLTGTRLVHVAASEMVNRFGETILAKCGYSRVGIAASAGAPDSLRNLRTRHNRMFLLVDGLDYPSGNAKNCSFAFDRFGYGAAVCAGPSITAAWKIAETDGKDYVAQAQQAAERMKKNITRYITIL